MYISENIDDFQYMDTLCYLSYMIKPQLKFKNIKYHKGYALINGLILKNKYILYYLTYQYQM